MAVEFPFSLQDIDILMAALGLFIILIIYGLLQKSKILGKNKAIHLIVGTIFAFLVIQNEVISFYIIDFSSNISFLLLVALVFVVIMTIARASALSMFMLFILLIMVLITAGIYPFSLLQFYISGNFLRILIILHILIMLVYWLMRDNSR